MEGKLNYWVKDLHTLSEIGLPAKPVTTCKYDFNDFASRH